MSAALLAAALVALPQGAVRYRAELGGEPVGVAELRIRCVASCFAAYESRLRLPAESGGGIERRRVEVEVDRAGRWRRGALRVGRGDGLADGAGVPDAIPAAVLEVALAADAGTAERCLPFFDERDGIEARACARRDEPAGRIAADANGVPEIIVPGADGFPEVIEVAGRFRFVRDPAARVPTRAPRIAGTRVAGPTDPARARAFCGVPRDPDPALPTPALPTPRAAGGSCREETAAYLAAARARGLDGRTAVGVAWDGSGFVWHSWAEVRAGGAWIPVDPSFGELPAHGPRFTVGRFSAAGGAARNAAGARILSCWGTARVEE